MSGLTELHTAYRDEWHQANDEGDLGNRSLRGLKTALAPALDLEAIERAVNHALDANDHDTADRMLELQWLAEEVHQP